MLNTKKSNNPVIQHSHFGPALPQAKWVPAPRYLMRRDVILDIARHLTRGRFLEFGCGAGGLLHDLARMGFQAVGVDHSTSARSIADVLLAQIPDAEVFGTSDHLSEESFDLLAAFVVLDHIEDDLSALTSLARYLKPGGDIMVSVPAHPERWNAADVWAGHYRRYNREDIVGLVEAAGFEVTQVLCYGFPIANIMERLSAQVYARQTNARGGEKMDQAARTEESGSDRSVLTRLWPAYSSVAGTLAMRSVLKLQRHFLKTDRGIGYLVVGRKR
jgi:SAM-dependent methyltransferase